jgi:hypothetical protein
LANSKGGEEQVALVGLGNEIDLAAHDGWAMVAPYGTWEHSQGLQRFGRHQAEEIVANYKSLWSRIKRAVVGLPIFKGHPDHVAFANIHTDKTEYGQIADLEARDDGLWMKPVLSGAGADLVLGGLKFVSPNWRARMVGLANDGRRIFEPALLDSVGLTAKPNIPGPSLANSAPAGAAENQPQLPPEMDKLKIIALLAALGRPLANEATESEINEALGAVTPVAAELVKRPEATALANETTARTAAETRVTDLTAQLANERKARIGLLVDAAVREGRITEANRDTWSKRLERDFDTESTALANEKPAVKTGSVTGDLGSRKQEAASDVQGRIVSLVNEKMNDPKLAHLSPSARHDAAYAAVKREKPDLFKPQQQQASA